MKLFFTRTINVLLIVVILLVYQLNATARARRVDDYNKAQEAYEQLMNPPTTDSGSVVYADGTYTGSAMGFKGDITVQVTVEGGKITAVEITDSSDDDEYLGKAKALLDEIVSNQGTDGLDVVSGATFSSNGILDAFNAAMATAETVESGAAGGYSDGTYTGSAMGFKGDITVQATVEGGKITAVEITDASDDDEYLSKAKALLDEIVSNQGTDGLDVVSGATFSSNGILDAFNAAMEGGAS